MGRIVFGFVASSWAAGVWHRAIPLEDETTPPLLALSDVLVAVGWRACV